MPINKAVVLSAGKGSRLLPLTEDRPKCLLDCSGRTLLEWQLDALFGAGVEEAVIVTGFRAELVDVVAARWRQQGRNVRTLFNPFYHVADNLGSVWMARAEMDRDVLLLNGDTLLTADIVALVREKAGPLVTVTVNEKADFDDDDMKVLRDGDRLVSIGKTISRYDCESIGFLAFRGDGRRSFLNSVDAAMRGPEGVSSWYLKVIDQLAPSGIVSTIEVGDREWGEVDFPADLENAQALTARWRAIGS